MRILIAGLVAISVASCARHPTQADLEFAAYDRVISEKVSKGQLTPSEADLARQQYAGNLRTRESGIAASYGVANSNDTYARNSSMAMGMALMCAGQRGGHC